MEEYLEFFNQDDPTVQKAIQILSDELSVPQVEEKNALVYQTKGTSATTLPFSILA